MRNVIKTGALLAFVVFYGCKDSSTNSGSIPGDIIGTIYQVDDTLYQPMSDKSGVNVSFVGTPYSTLSDSTGKWHLTNIPAGTYTIRFSKGGYVSLTRQNLVFGGNGTFFYNAAGNSGYTAMYPISNLFPNIILRPFEDLVQFNYLRDTIWGGSHHSVYDTIITKLGVATFSSRSQFMYNGQAVFGAIFFGKNETIDPGDPTSSLYSIINYYDNKNDSSGVANFVVHRSDLLQSGFSENEIVYCCAFAFAYNNNYDSWVDANTGRDAYSGFSPHHSEVKSFILP
jgi:hypothetical protein